MVPRQTDSRTGSQAGAKGQLWGQTLYWEVEKVLEMGGSDSCTTT
jgi:hypothetical protein